MSLTRAEQSRKSLFEPIETFKIYHGQMEVRRGGSKSKGFNKYFTYTLPDLLALSREKALKDIDNLDRPGSTSVRAVLDLNFQLIFGLQGRAGNIVPAHKDLADKCYCADDIIFNDADEIHTINNKSSGFLPEFIAIQIMTLQLYVQGYKFASEVTFVEIHGNGGNCASVSHFFKRKNLFVLLDDLIKHYHANNLVWAIHPNHLELATSTSSEISPVKSTSTVSLLQALRSPLAPLTTNKFHHTTISTPVTPNSKKDKNAKRTLFFATPNSGESQEIKPQLIASPPKPVRKKLFLGSPVSSVPLTSDNADISSCSLTQATIVSHTWLSDYATPTFLPAYMPIPNSLPSLDGFVNTDESDKPIATYDSASDSEDENENENRKTIKRYGNN